MSVSDMLAPFAARNQSSPPARLGQRFSTTEFLPEAGNTIVCHLDFDDAGHARILNIRDRMMALPGASQFLTTPVDSLHMTVFEGVIETRRTEDAWPPDIDRDAPVDDVTDAFLNRLAEFDAPDHFRVRASGLYPMGLRLEGATQEDKTCLRIWRDRLAAAFGYRHAEHDSYRHHMTLGYATGWLSDPEVDAWQAEMAVLLSELEEKTFLVPLKAPAFCTFADMKRFEQRLVLKQQWS